MSHIFRISIAATCLSAAVPAAAQGAHDWALQVDPGTCTLNRTVTEPAPRMIAIWTRPGTNLNTLVIAGPDMPGLDGSTLIPVTVQFADGKGLVGKAGLFPVSTQAGRGVAINELGPDFLDAFARTTTISVTIASKTYGPYALPSAGAAVRALRTCVKDQLVEWGADPAQFARGGATPVSLAPNNQLLDRRTLANLAGSADAFYVVFRLTVSPDGIVDGCEVIDSKPSDRVRKMGCAALMSKKLFTPAHDAQGKPVRGVAVFEAGVIRTGNRFRGNGQ